MTPQPKRSFDQQPQQNPQRGNFTIKPNSIIDHAYMFTHAEKTLLDLALRNPGMPIPDQKWREVSGLDQDPEKGARMKEIAAKGLSQKGLVIQGKGKNARYRFEIGTWEIWWRSQPSRDRATTSGRAPTVKAKPGMIVHESCADKCQKLCEANAECSKAEVISISSGQQNAKPISRNSSESESENAKSVSRNSSQVIDNITTDLGNTVPVEHAEAINKAIHKASRRINAPDTKDPKAYEAAVIRETIAKLISTKTAATQTQIRRQREDELAAARKILNWDINQIPQEDRAWALEKIAPSEKDKAWAREIIAGSGQ